MSQYMNPRFSLFDAYTPGEQPQDRQYLKLNTNESPYPPAPGVQRAVTAEAVQRLRLYNDPECSKLTQKLAETTGLKAENILCGNGSDELLAFAFQAWGHQGAAFPDVSYGLYPVLADLYDVKAVKVPLREDYSIDDRDYLGLPQGLIVIANPNAPTGLSLLPRQLAHIAEENPGSVVLVDEAYVDFGGQSCLPLIGRYDNLAVVQTFSKSRSLAGARLGFVAAPAALIKDLRKLKNAFNPYNVNSLTQMLGLAALKEKEYYQLQSRAIQQARESTRDALGHLGFRVLPSQANFLFAAHPQIGGEALYLALKKRGILVRYFSAPRTRAWVRITVGTREQMEELLTAIRQIIGGIRP
jgi:histidinol-phosphate aminotransferase